MVPPDLVPHAALVKEWCKRKIAESPRWSPEKWRRIAAIHGVELADGPTCAEAPAHKDGRDAA
ncbi:hypothetical protein GCM10017600_20620 [Streptosporangium carneum]|uniref:Uncharacterized protein n=1 Tax=Streptosporangium carneum TaxID=47481 RepID=A0A9W6HYG9_9ACTN|nr:hypothetical protein GCM10017600_20620 [Streptosporangium carneum]